MASPVSDSYSTATGGSIYGGRSGLPAWRSAMVANTWAEIPATLLSALDPKNNAALNPNYPASPEWQGSTGQSAAVTAWCGACYDAADDVLYLPLQGGHGDYAGNEPYKIALNAASPEWVMMRPPSGAIGNLLTTNDGQESTGVYADGQPRAVHSYNKPVYVPGIGPFLAVQGNTAWSAAGGSLRPVQVDPITGVGTLKTSNAYSSSTSGGGACFDPTRGSQGSIWWRGVDTGYFSRYDVAADTWAQIGSSSTAGGYTSLCYLPDDDCILWGTDGGTAWAVIDCATGTKYTPTFTGTVAGSLRPGSCQPHWVPTLGAVCAWDNSADTTLITRLTPGANPRTDAWTIDTLTVAGGGVTPSARATSGTYGRFAYSPNLNGFVLLNATNQTPYFYALG